MAFQITEVSSLSDIRDFLRFPGKIYGSSPAWIQPLDRDIEAVFDPAKNPVFRYGECTRWLLKDGAEVIGRVAAFIDRRKLKEAHYDKVGGLGFFECVDDRQAATLLFDKCRDWLRERDMEAMDGPVNFGTRDKWWGLLVEGFELEPNYCCNYNPPYYKKLFEDYGFRLFFNQYTFGRRIHDPFTEKLLRKGDRLLASDENFRFEALRRSQFNKYVEDFRTIYNSAWGGHAGVPQLTKMQAKKIFYRFKPIMDPRTLWYGYYNDQPVAFFLSIPEINQIFKHLNGRFDLWHKMKFLILKRRGVCKKMLGLIFGVVPEFQHRGVDAALVLTFYDQIVKQKLPYTDLEMNWVGDFNPKMIRVIEQVGARVFKTHVTYRYLFDPSRPFERMPIMH